MGHRGDPTLLHDVYAGVVTEAKAKEYFAIAPQPAAAVPGGATTQTDNTSELG